MDMNTMDETAQSLTNRCLFCQQETDEISMGDDAFIICDECVQKKA